MVKVRQLDVRETHRGYRVALFHTLAYRYSQMMHWTLSTSIVLIKSRMRETRTSGSDGGARFKPLSLPPIGKRRGATGTETKAAAQHRWKGAGVMRDGWKVSR